MSDKIKIEELKMYLGTGILFQCPDEDGRLWEDKIDYIYPNGTIETVEGCAFTIDEIGTEECKPMVRPLDRLTLKDLKSCGAEPAYPATERSIKSAVSSVKSNAKRGFLELDEACVLVGMHYDIFNWIGRGLAVEL